MFFSRKMKKNAFSVKCMGVWLFSLVSLVEKSRLFLARPFVFSAGTFSLYAAFAKFKKHLASFFRH